MPHPGTVWAANTWDPDAWSANTWADAVEGSLAFVADMNTRLLVFLRDHYSVTGGDLTTLTTRYLKSLSGEYTARFKKLIQDATDAMS